MQLNDGPRKDGRRRRRRRRRGGRNRSGGGGQQQQQQQPRHDPNDERLRAASAQVPQGPEELTQFNLFCAYHLGVTRADGYKFQSVNEVARRFGVDVNTIKQALKHFNLETESLRELGFDSELAQLDIRVAPEGVSRRELARTMFAEFDIPEAEPWPESRDDDDDEGDDLDDEDDDDFDDDEDDDDAELSAA